MRDSTDKPEFPAESCRQFDRELADYLEGEPRPEIERHARDCPFCSVVLADLQAIRKASEALVPEDPPGLVWANLRAALAAEGILREPEGWLGRLSGFPWLRVAAPVGVLASLAIVGALLVVSPSRLGKVAPRSRTAMTVPAATAEADLAPDQLAALDQLEKSYAERRDSLDPAAKAVYQKSLDSLDASIRECRESIHAQPSDTLAQEYLLAAYTEKADVLQSALDSDVR